MTYEEFEDSLRTAYEAYAQQVRDIHVRWTTNWPDGERLIELARTLCESDGYHPDDLVMGFPKQPPCYAGKHSVAVVFPVKPLWCQYTGEAKAALEFMQKAQSQKAPDTKAVVDFLSEIRKAAGR